MNTKWNRPIAVLQVIGGLIGFLSTLGLGAELLSSPDILMMGLAFSGLYLLSIAAGVLLWANTRRGRTWSLWVQALQIPTFSLGGLLYLFVSPLALMATLHSEGFNFNLTFGSEWEFGYGQAEPFRLGINLIALLIFIYLSRQTSGPAPALDAVTPDGETLEVA